MEMLEIVQNLGISSETYNKTMLVPCVLIFYSPTMIIANSLDNGQTKSVTALVLCRAIEPTEDKRWG